MGYKPGIPMLTAYPELVAQWHPERNGGLEPETLTAGSNYKVWWRCPVDHAHEWQAPIYRRTEGSGCPICSGKLVVAATSLQMLFPGLAAEWHADKNGELSPEQVAPGSPKIVWWRCHEDPTHEWKARVYNRAIRNTGC